MYIGETSRSLYTRCNQHLQDFKRATDTVTGENVSSFYKDHLQECHPDQVQDLDIAQSIRWDVLDSHRDPLSRQTMEAVYIQQAITSGKIQGLRGVQVRSLNRKGEYFSARERWIRE